MIINFNSLNQNIVFCCIDNTHTYDSNWVRELIKNQSDYTINNIVNSTYSVLQGMDEDLLLKEAADKNYKYAVVFSTGTEFINGVDFFEEIEKMITSEFFIAGHVLDRGNAYYELHQQCYIINLIQYKELGYPAIGKQELGTSHIQEMPQRSTDNWHDDYTPISVGKGNTLKQYDHKCHGWNILSTGLYNNFKVLVFNQTIRQSKKHYYPESQKDFNKEIEWAYFRQSFCQTEFVHTTTTDLINFAPNKPFRQIVTPASGLWYKEYIDTVNPVKIIFYDYNQKALDYWKTHAPTGSNISCEFVLCDLLLGASFAHAIDTELADDTIINLSNIFNYEATTFFYSLEYRLYQENKLLDELRSIVPDAYVNFSVRASHAFSKQPLCGRLKDVNNVNINTLTKPTWHVNKDWL